MSVGYRTMSMAEMSTILRNLQRSLESLQSQVNSLSGGGGGGIGGGATSHNLLSITHSDTETDTVVQGDLIVGGSTPTWERLALGASGTFLKSDGSDPSWATLQASDIDTLALLLDQTTPQTVVNGIPLLDKEYDDFSNPDEFVNKGYVDWVATAIGANYYMTDDTDGDTGYKICSLTPSAGSETYIEESGVTDGQLLGTWISDVGEAPAKLPRGMYDWFMFAEKTSGTKTLRLYWKLYERKTDDSEVLVATSSESNELKMGEKTSYVVPLALDSDYTPDSGSRIVGKIYASVSGSGNDPTVKIYYQGISGSRWEIPSSVEILSEIFVKQDSSPTFAELTLDGALIGKEITTPSNPSAGYNKLYCKSDDKWYTLDSEGNEVELGSGGGGASEFLDLTDTPSSYSGQSGKVVAVKDTEDGLEFTSAAGGASEFLDLTDTPSSYSGEGGRCLKVSASEDGLEFAEIVNVYIEEDCDSLTIGDLDGQGNYNQASAWSSLVNGTSTIKVVSNPDNGKMIRITGVGGDSVLKAISTLSNNVGLNLGCYVRFKFKTNDVSKGNAGLGLYKSDNTLACQVYFRGASSEIRFYNGSSAYTIMSASNNTWYTVEMIIFRTGATSASAQVWIDGVYKGAWNCASFDKTINKVFIYTTPDASVTKITDFDDILVKSVESGLGIDKEYIYLGNTFHDNFGDASRHWAWRDISNNGSITEADDKLTLSIANGVNGDWWSGTFNAPFATIGLRSHICTIETKLLTFQVNTETSTGLFVANKISFSGSGYAYTIEYNNGNVNVVNIGSGNVATASGVNTLPIWFRIRLSGEGNRSVVYFDYSTDGSNWTNLHTLNDFDVDFCGLFAKNWGSYLAIDAEYDYFKIAEEGGEAGVATFLGLSDTPSSYSSGLVWVNEAGNALVFSGNYNPDVFPETPDSLDDEFEDGGSIDAKWTIVNNPSGDDALRQDLYEGYLHVGLLELGTDNFDNLIRLYQTPPAGNQTMSFIAKVALSAEGLGGNAAEWACVGIYLGNSANDELVGAIIEFNDAAGTKFPLGAQGSVDNGSGGLSAMSAIQKVLIDATKFVYLKLEKSTANAYTSSNTYRAYFSFNGIIWQEVGNQTKTFTNNCDEVGIYFRRPKSQTGTPKCYALVDFFRRTS